MFSARQPSLICPTKFFQSSTDYYPPPLATKLRNPGNFLPIATEFLKILRFSTKFRKNLINTNENREICSRILPPPLRPKFKTQQNLPTRLLPSPWDQMPDWPSHLPDDPESQDRTLFPTPDATQRFLKPVIRISSAVSGECYKVAYPLTAVCKSLNHCMLNCSDGVANILLP